MCMAVAYVIHLHDCLSWKKDNLAFTETLESRLKGGFFFPLSISLRLEKAASEEKVEPALPEKTEESPAIMVRDTCTESTFSSTLDSQEDTQVSRRKPHQADAETQAYPS